MRFSARRHSFWLLAGGCGTALVIFAVFLFYAPAVAPTPYATVQSIAWTLQQGTDNGTPWFTESEIDQSGPVWGFPFQLPPGGSFNDSLVIISQDSVDRPVCSVSVSAPLHIVATFPALPMRLEAGEDNLLTLTINVAAAAGTVIPATGVIDALGCTLPPG